PWERESGVHPIPQRDSGPPAAQRWEWNAALGRSYPTAQLEELTGTGPVPVIPLLPGDRAWSAGVRAPRQPKGALAPPAPPIPDEVGVEEDKQPSIQMRAMRAGNLARATAIVSAALLLSRMLGLVRTTIFASAFGVTMQADAFTNAFVLPDTI